MPDTITDRQLQDLLDDPAGRPLFSGVMAAVPPAALPAAPRIPPLHLPCPQCRGSGLLATRTWGPHVTIVHDVTCRRCHGTGSVRVSFLDWALHRLARRLQQLLMRHGS